MSRTHKFGFTKDEFLSLHTPPGPTGEDVVSVADEMLNGRMLVIKAAPLYTGYTLDTFDWTRIPPDDSKETYQMYLFSLYPIGYAIKAYELTGDEKYVLFADKLLKSWLKFFSDPISFRKCPAMMGKHCIALRAETLIYYILVTSEAGLLSNDFRKTILKHLELHIDYLCDPDLYAYNHNHGVFQDRALIYLAWFFDGSKKQKLIDLAKKRLMVQYNYAFSEEMISVENSYDYHIIALRLFREIANLLNWIGDEYGKTLLNNFDKATKYLAYLLKPDGYAPMIGDSKLHRVSKAEARTLGGPLLYAVTRSREGEKPTEKAAVFPKSGYMASRQYWAREDSFTGKKRMTDAMWCMFKSGYTSMNHKHADDLSFMMHCKGHDVFVDTGVFSYSFASKYRNYFISALAHNTVIVDNHSYPVSPSHFNTTGFFAHNVSNGFYNYAGGFNNAYSGVEIDRHFYSFDETIILFDNIRSDDTHTYSQLFHLGENMSIVSVSDTEVLLKIADTDYHVLITQHLGNTTLSQYYGENKECKFGIISNKMNTLAPINTLKFDVSGSNVDIITQISVLKNSEKLDCTRKIKFTQSTYSFDITCYNNEKFTIRLSPSNRIRNLSIVTEQNNNVINFINRSTTDVNSKFGWEIYNEDGSLLHSEPLTNNNSFKYVFKTKDAFKVYAIMIDSNGQVYREPVKGFNGQVLDKVTNNITEITYTNEGKTFTFVNECDTSGIKYFWSVLKKIDGRWKNIYKSSETTDDSFKCTFSSDGSFRVKSIAVNENGDKLSSCVDIEI
ncbi:MAG: alginate lyase family protein [Clostridia bacterium]|nr:alginate lyase family protein [Clostridia bacterium]